jgi:hypothetical protein
MMMTTMEMKKKRRRHSLLERVNKMKKDLLKLILERKPKKKLTMALDTTDKADITEVDTSQEEVEALIKVDLIMELIPRLSISLKKELKEVLKADKKVKIEVEAEEEEEVNYSK